MNYSKVLFNKYFYIKSSLLQRLGNNTPIKQDVVYNTNRLINMVYDFKNNETTLRFYDTPNSDRTFTTQGNLIPNIVDTLNKDYTKGVIIAEDHKVREL